LKRSRETKDKCCANTKRSRIIEKNSSKNIKVSFKNGIFAKTEASLDRNAAHSDKKKKVFTAILSSGEEYIHVFFSALIKSKADAPSQKSPL